MEKPARLVEPLPGHRLRQRGEQLRIQMGRRDDRARAAQAQRAQQLVILARQHAQASVGNDGLRAVVVAAAILDGNAAIARFHIHFAGGLFQCDAAILAVCGDIGRDAVQ